jgi:hypothetical protein
MSDITIAQFCDKHDACEDGRTWALKNCTSMQEVWNKIKPDWLIWIATREGVLTDKELRLFAVWSARQVQHLMADSRSINALDVAEQYSHGNATKEELAAAWYAASSVAARAATSDAAWSAAWSAARASASDAASDAAWSAAWASVSDSASKWSNARAAQADWLRKNTQPNFKEAKP